MSCSAFEDELAALHSIYSDQLVVDTAKSSISIAEIQFRDDFFCVKFDVPFDYPDESPSVTLLLAARNPSLHQAVLADVAAILSNQRGEVVLFSVIECIRLALMDYDSSKLNNASELNPLTSKGCPVLCSTEIFNVLSPEPSVEFLDATDAADCSWPTERHQAQGECCEVDIHHGDPVLERGSTFLSHFARVSSMGEVRYFRDSLLLNKKLAKATHNIFAYRFTDPKSGVCFHDCDDDGEAGAGARLSETLRLMGADGVAVVVSRWFGGTLLGPDRFRLINNCARRLLETKAQDCLLKVVKTGTGLHPTDQHCKSKHRPKKAKKI